MGRPPGSSVWTPSCSPRSWPRRRASTTPFTQAGLRNDDSPLPFLDVPFSERIPDFGLPKQQQVDNGKLWEDYNANPSHWTRNANNDYIALTNFSRRKTWSRSSSNSAAEPASPATNPDTQEYASRRSSLTASTPDGSVSLRPDLVVADSFLQHDLDASPIFPRYEVPLYGTDRFRTDPVLTPCSASSDAVLTRTSVLLAPPTGATWIVTSSAMVAAPGPRNSPTASSPPSTPR